MKTKTIDFKDGGLESEKYRIAVNDEVTAHEKAGTVLALMQFSWPYQSPGSAPFRPSVPCTSTRSLGAESLNPSPSHDLELAAPHR
jgi:hypothetical protein